jgi:hypothetical protein
LPQSAASIEERLAFLHAGLKITDAQAAIWDPFAEEVRNSLDAIEVMRGGKGDGQPLMLPGKVGAGDGSTGAARCAAAVGSGDRPLLRLPKRSPKKDCRRLVADDPGVM